MGAGENDGTVHWNKWSSDNNFILFLACKFNWILSNWRFLRQTGTQSLDLQCYHIIFLWVTRRNKQSYQTLQQKNRTLCSYMLLIFFHLPNVWMKSWAYSDLAERAWRRAKRHRKARKVRYVDTMGKCSTSDSANCCTLSTIPVLI